MTPITIFDADHPDPRPVSSGALEEWRRSLRERIDGQHPSASSTWKWDELWRAAQHDANGLDEMHGGLYVSARRSFERSESLLEQWIEINGGRE